jgi:hypothetical protein
VVIVRWAKRAHPDLPEDDGTILWIARLVGIGGLGVALFFVMIIVRSFSNWTAPGFWMGVFPLAADPLVSGVTWWSRRAISGVRVLAIYGLF